MGVTAQRSQTHHTHSCSLTHTLKSWWIMRQRPTVCHAAALPLVLEIHTDTDMCTNKCPHLCPQVSLDTLIHPLWAHCCWNMSLMTTNRMTRRHLSQRGCVWLGSDCSTCLIRSGLRWFLLCAQAVEQCRAAFKLTCEAKTGAWLFVQLFAWCLMILYGRRCDFIQAEDRHKLTKSAILIPELSPIFPLLKGFLWGFFLRWCEGLVEDVVMLLCKALWKKCSVSIQILPYLY